MDVAAAAGHGRGGREKVSLMRWTLVGYHWGTSSRCVAMPVNYLYQRIPKFLTVLKADGPCDPRPELLQLVQD